ncbi:MAG: LuxR C-terminal-related transcriptional regulator, partial [Bacteroidota bacterium]
SILDSITSVVQKNGTTHWIPFIETTKADNLLRLKLYDEAESMYLSARSKFMAANNKVNTIHLNERLYTFYKQRGQFERALAYHEEFKTMNDSFLLTQHDDVLAGLEASHALELKEKENKVLTELKISNAKVIARQRWIGCLGLLSILALVMLVYNYFKNSKTQKKLNQQLQAANQRLKEKNRNINSIANELMFVTDHFPEEIARLDKDFNLLFSNEKFRNLFDLPESESATNIFPLLNLSEEVKSGILNDLDTSDNTSFMWRPAFLDEVYQVKVVKNINEKGEAQYIMVFDDVTQLKVAEVARMKKMQHTLNDLKTDYFQLHQEKDQLNNSLDSKNKELALKMMQIAKRNGALQQVLDNLKEIYAQSSSKSKLKISKVIGQLNDLLDIEDGWRIFNTYFREIHPSFLSALQSRSQELSNNEFRHCTYIKIGLSNQEVAEMLNVSSKTVEVARYRIKKKLNLSKEESLSRFIGSIS